MKNYRARGITADGKPIFDERHEHITVAQWLTAHGIFFIHVPNEGKRNIVTGKTLKKMGMKNGVADFLIFDPPPRRQQECPHGCVLELKALDGKKPRREQFTFLADMHKRGFVVSWTRGADAAIKWLENLGYGGK